MTCHRFSEGDSSPSKRVGTLQSKFDSTSSLRRSSLSTVTQRNGRYCPPPELGYLTNQSKKSYAIRHGSSQSRQLRQLETGRAVRRPVAEGVGRKEFPRLPQQRESEGPARLVRMGYCGADEEVRQVSGTPQSDERRGRYRQAGRF